MKQTAVDYLDEKDMYINWLLKNGEISLIKADDLRFKYLEEAKKIEKSNLLRYGFKCFTNGLVFGLSSAIIAILIAKFI
jgi:hypothetical protein